MPPTKTSRKRKEETTTETSLQEEVKILRARMDSMEKILNLPRQLFKPDGVCPTCWRAGKENFGSVVSKDEFTHKAYYTYRCNRDDGHTQWVETIEKS